MNQPCTAAPDYTYSLSQVCTRNAWIPLAQWLALLSMSLEHVTKFLWPASAFTPWAILVGRIAFPLFAGMVAWHLVHNTRHPMRYVGRLFLIGFIAQLPYALVVTPFTLNVCYTLAFGLFAVALVDRLPDIPSRLAAVIVLGCVGLLAGVSVEYAHLGLLLVPAYVLAFRHPNHLAAVVPLLLIAAFINAPPLAPLVSLLTATALIVIARQPAMPLRPIIRLPRRLWLAWYPLHLALIALLLPLIGQARPAL